MTPPVTRSFLPWEISYDGTTKKRHVKRNSVRGILSEEYCRVKSIAVRSIPTKRIGTGRDRSAELDALELTWLFRISGTPCGMLSLTRSVARRAWRVIPGSAVRRHEHVAGIRASCRTHFQWLGV
jgi:hypothetical protein